MKFEDQYLDVLQNIEYGIVRVYREHPRMHDWDVMGVLEALIAHYQAELSGRPARTMRLTPEQKQMYEVIEVFCDWRLGRASLETTEGEEVDLSLPSITLEEIIACLRRILKSVKMWNKEGGQRGYLEFVSPFLP